RVSALLLLEPLLVLRRVRLARGGELGGGARARCGICGARALLGAEGPSSLHELAKCRLRPPVELIGLLLRRRQLRLESLSFARPAPDTLTRLGELAYGDGQRLLQRRSVTSMLRREPCDRGRVRLGLRGAAAPLGRCTVLRLGERLLERAHALFGAARGR